jgi:hypothetical protein
MCNELTELSPFQLLYCITQTVHLLIVPFRLSTVHPHDPVSYRAPFSSTFSTQGKMHAMRLAMTLALPSCRFPP